MLSGWLRLRPAAYGWLRPIRALVSASCFGLVERVCFRRLVGAGAVSGPVGFGYCHVSAFTGREAEMDRLAALTEGGAVVVSAIGVTTGVGKTISVSKMH